MRMTPQPNTEKLPQEGELKPILNGGIYDPELTITALESQVDGYAQQINRLVVEKNAQIDKSDSLRESLANTQSLLAAASERERVLREGVKRFLCVYQKHLEQTWIEFLMEIAWLEQDPPYSFKPKPSPTKEKV